MRAGVDIHIAGAGGSVTHMLRVRAVMVRNSAGAGRSGMKKTVQRRALLCALVHNLITNTLVVQKRMVKTQNQLEHTSEPSKK